VWHFQAIESARPRNEYIRRLPDSNARLCWWQAGPEIMEDMLRIITHDLNNSKKKNINFLLLSTGLIGILGFVIMLWITPNGAGVSTDSITYIYGARSILSGEGFS
jgi:hypothetical protein